MTNRGGCAIIVVRLEREANFTMVGKQKLKMRLGRVIFGFFFAMIAVFGLLGNALTSQEVAYADPVETTTTTESSGEGTTNNGLTGDGCQASLGAIGWLVCPTTGKIAEAVDWLYDKIQDILVINPISSEDGSPIYEIWKYCRGLTNIVFIIFLLVVIYSQITGLGISNYGIKKALPKLIVVVILVNLSFFICSLVVDLSNIIGNSLRGLFDSVQEAAVAGMSAGESGASATDLALAEADMFSAIATGSALAIGGTVIAFETGAIWMLIPVVLGAIVAVATGLITIALRQAVVALLVMISPLAIVAYMLPNTENLFTKWRKLLTQMLVFYPMFSLLFGASALAGFAIIASAQDGFGLILGTAVQIFPLFFSWKLMQMSGTFLGDINAKIRTLAARPVGGARAWSDSRKMSSRQKHLAAGSSVMPSRRLMQYMSNRKVAREAENAENAELIKNRGLAYRAQQNYRNGVPTREGERAYANQARSMEYQRAIERDKNNMNKGLGYLAAAGTAQRVRLEQLDAKNVMASDKLKMEQARGEKIAYENAVGYHKRMENAVNSHFDDLHAGEKTYRPHNMDTTERAEARARYAAANQIMEGNLGDIQYAAADAAHAFDTQKKILETKYQKYFELTPPTKDVEFRLGELTKMPNAAENIDAILPGLRILNQRGDTDLVKAQLDNLLSKDIGGGIRLGTHASQALASFLMFEVKDNDPYLRRFGKYINLETARVYNKNERQVMEVTYDEYIKGYHDGEPVTENNPTGRMYAKKSMVNLMEGTAFDGIERTALDNYDSSLRKVYTNENGELDLAAYKAKREEVDKAIAPQFISANLKFLSGSEQIGAAVKAKTGFFSKQDSETGEYFVMPIWDDEKEAKKLFSGFRTPEEKAQAKENLKSWYREQTLQYLLDQTPHQILGLRSDYHDGLREHLADAFNLNKDEDLTEEELAARREYEKEVSRIQTQYGDEPIGEAKRKRDKEMRAAREKIAGAEFRKILEDKGILEQIYRTRRSGAANAAKSWVRGWLGLDDEAAIRDYEDKKRPKKKNSGNQKDQKANVPPEERVIRELGKRLLKQMEQQEREELFSAQGHKTSDDDEGEEHQIYDEDKRKELRDYIYDLYQNMKNLDDEDFYEESLAYIVENLSDESYIAQEYQRMHERDSYASAYDMKEWLLGMLNDPDNY